MRIRNIFFDMGDTLVHRPIDRQIGYAMLLRKFGYDVSNEALLEAYDKARPMVPPETQYKQDMDEVNARFMIKIRATIANLGLSPVDEIARRLVESDFNRACALCAGRRSNDIHDPVRLANYKAAWFR